VTIEIPGGALVVLVGAAGSGKSTFAARHFRPTDVLSSDAFRGLVAGDEADQRATDDAFALLHQALAVRMRRGLLTVIDATNVQGWARQGLLELAERRGRPAVAIVLDPGVDVCLQRARDRLDRPVHASAVRRQYRDLQHTLAGRASEGFASWHVLDSQAAIDAAQIRAPVAPEIQAVAGTQMSRRNCARPGDARSPDRHRNA
jgi:protein phosphatase